MSRMKMHTSHMAAAAHAEAMFSCANIALIPDTILLVSVFVILVSRIIALLALIALLVIISIICKNTAAPKDRYRCFG